MAEDMTPQQARRIVRSAIASGTLTRPDRCTKCGNTPSRGRDGRPRIQGHHHNGYDRPLDVEWLCAKCHRAVTPLPTKMGAPTRGERNGQAKLTEEKVRDIRARFLNGEHQSALARAFSVHHSLIAGIVKRKWWAHVE